jgi:Skp family chaperone for outer membrane proteins
MKTRTLIAAVALVAPLLAVAQTPSTPRVDQRQVNQEARIQQGAQSGSLTQKEATKLEKGQTHVQNMENKAMADGTVNKKEAGRIENAQDQQSKKVYREKHDRQHDYNHDGKQDRPNKGKKQH